MLRPQLCVLVAFHLAAINGSAAEPAGGDVLAPIYQPVVKPTVTSMLKRYRAVQFYQDDDFPMDAAEFAAFREDVIERFTQSVNLESWTVRGAAGKTNALAGKFRNTLLKTIRHHGVTMEVRLIEIPQTGDTIPAVICLPEGDGPHPGVCVFSGHSRSGLRDHVLDFASNSGGVAARLAQAGFATIAVEKLDTGYLSRTFPSGVDENEIALFRLGFENLITRSHQLMACLAATEILATHPRVDPDRIGATGYSLGGFLTVQTALLTDRIKAVADFGRKTLHVPPDVTAESFTGPQDLCHILPGMMQVCDRHLLTLAYCPRPMLAGHGRRDRDSHIQGPVHYQQLFQRQYAALGRADQYSYHIHDGGDVMPVDAVIAYFQRVFDATPR